MLFHLAKYTGAGIKLLSAIGNQHDRLLQLQPFLVLQISDCDLLVSHPFSFILHNYLL